MNDTEIFDFLAFGLSHLDGKIKYKVNPSITGEYDNQFGAMMSDAIAMYDDSNAVTAVSGGIDSSALLILSGTDGITASFPGSDMDETHYAKIAAKKARTQLTRVKPTGKDCVTHLDQLLDTMGCPIASLGVYAQWKVWEEAHLQNYDVILSGNGPDELLAGYLPYFGSYLKTLLLQGDFTTAFSEATGAMTNMQFVRTIHRLSMLSNLAPDIVKEVIATRRMTALLDKDFVRDNDLRHYRKFKIGRVDKLLENDANISTVGQIGYYEDTAAAHFGMECARPFMHDNLMTYCSSLPMNQKIRNGITKYAFRKAMDGIVPDEIRLRKDKIGFTTPEWYLMKGALATDMQKTFRSKEFRQRGYYADDVAMEFRQLMNKKSQYTPRQFWRLYCMEKWLG